MAISVFIFQKLKLILVKILRKLFWENNPILEDHDLLVLQALISCAGLENYWSDGLSEGQSGKLLAFQCLGFLLLGVSMDSKTRSNRS